MAYSDFVDDTRRAFYPALETFLSENPEGAKQLEEIFASFRESITDAGIKDTNGAVMTVALLALAPIVEIVDTVSKEDYDNAVHLYFLALLNEVIGK